VTEGKKKSLFDRAIDALTDRDEKEAAAQAKADAAKNEAETRAKLAAAKDAVEQPAAEEAPAKRAVDVDTTGEKAATMKATAEKAATPPKRGVVTVRSLRIRADHRTSSEVVGGLVNGDEVTILSTWTNGRDTWAQLDRGWAAMVYHGETYIRVVEADA
jgi:hypothetical protein